MSRWSYESAEAHARSVFKDHVATLTQGPFSSVLEWKRPNTTTYAVYITFHMQNVYVTGDLRDAIYRCTWQTNLQSCANTDIYYFTGKLSCTTHGETEWDENKCEEDIDSWAQMQLDENDADPERLAVFVEDLKSYAHENKERFLVHLFDCDYSEYGEVYESELTEAGDYMNADLVYYHTALKMAYEQLKEKAVDLNAKPV